MRICIIGKFPPIQGGVSMRTYWTAHGLAKRGHEVHVVTNAKEVRPPFRMHMRTQDWERCEGSYGKGSVTVHWTEPADRAQSYIPMASPFVSKLAAVASGAHSARAFDIIYSHYMEPYGVAGYLASAMTGLPHVVRMAGSDAGRLWHHPQLEHLYDHVLRCAQVVVAADAVARRAIDRGVDRRRIVAGGRYALPHDLFTPKGPKLELDRLRIELAASTEHEHAPWGEFCGRPYFGVYGKLGENKGSFALLSAMQKLKHAGLRVGLVTLAHGRPEIERRFREQARELGLTDRVLQIPFLPHWRVPEFLRSCLAVCCLEQDFPIGIHSPIIPLEVLLCGVCLVGSAEVIRKLPQWDRLPNGYGCVAIEDVNDVGDLSEKLAAIVRDPEPAATVAARGCRFARELQRDADFPQRVEQILLAAALRRPPAPINPELAGAVAARSQVPRFPLTAIAASAFAESTGGPPHASGTIDLTAAQELLASIERAVASGKRGLRPLAQAVGVEVAIAAAESECDEATRTMEAVDPLFRLRLCRWAMTDGELGKLVPIREPGSRVLRFDYDVAKFRNAKTITDFPRAARRHASAIVVFACSQDGRRDPLLIDGSTAKILELSDGSRTAAEIAGQLDPRRGGAAGADELKWIEELFLCGLVRLAHGKVIASKRQSAKSTKIKKVLSL